MTLLTFHLLLAARPASARHASAFPSTAVTPSRASTSVPSESVNTHWAETTPAQRPGSGPLFPGPRPFSCRACSAHPTCSLSRFPSTSPRLLDLKIHAPPAQISASYIPQTFLQPFRRQQKWSSHLGTSLVFLGCLLLSWLCVFEFLSRYVGGTHSVVYWSLSPTTSLWNVHTHSPHGDGEVSVPINPHTHS